LERLHPDFHGDAIQLGVLPFFFAALGQFLAVNHEFVEYAAAFVAGASA
jgi:hypothetical protein